MAPQALTCYHLPMRPYLLSPFALPVLAALALAACSPTYNWRDYSSPDAPFRAMFPDKHGKNIRALGECRQKLAISDQARLQDSRQSW
jgi:hypothetical protein